MNHRLLYIVGLSALLSGCSVLGSGSGPELPPNYMKEAFATPVMVRATPDNRVELAVFKKDGCAVVRRWWTDEGIRFYYCRGSSEVGYLLRAPGDASPSYFLGEDGRFVEYGTTGEAVGRQIGLPVRVKGIDRLDASFDLYAYTGQWTGRMNGRDVKLRVRDNGRILVEERVDGKLVRTATLRYRNRQGLLFAYEDRGPNGLYERRNKFCLSVDEKRKMLRVVEGDAPEVLLKRDDSYGEELVTRDRLSERHAMRKACRYDGVWAGGKDFESFTFAFDEDGAFYMKGEKGTAFGTWSASSDGTIKVKFEDGRKLTIDYSPYDDTMSARAPIGYRGRRQPEAPKHPVRTLKAGQQKGAN